MRLGSSRVDGLDYGGSARTGHKNGRFKGDQVKRPDAD